MHGANVAMLVALVAWGGVACYLLVLQGRMNRALEQLSGRQPAETPTVSIEPVGKA